MLPISWDVHCCIICTGIVVHSGKQKQLSFSWPGKKMWVQLCQQLHLVCAQMCPKYVGRREPLSKTGYQSSQQNMPSLFASWVFIFKVPARFVGLWFSWVNLSYNRFRDTCLSSHELVSLYLFNPPSARISCLCWSSVGSPRLRMESIRMEWNPAKFHGF